MPIRKGRARLIQKLMSSKDLSIDSRGGHELGAPQVRWPTKSLARAISKIGIAAPSTSLPLGQGLVDVTPDPSVGKQIIEFAPRIRLVGQGLITESKSRLWGGVLVRVLESRHEEKRRRCIQYLYVYTLQRSSVSVFYNIIVPLLIAGLAFFSPLVFGIPDDSGLLAILVWAVCIPLFLLAVLPHLSHDKQ